MIKVLVTAIGGDLGQAILKALKISQQPYQLYGCDAETSGIGAAFVDSYHVLPYANDPSFVDALNSLCKSLDIQVVIPSADVEIGILTRLGDPPTLPCGTIVICQESAWFQTYSDKLTCMRNLLGCIPLAHFADGTDFSAVKNLISTVGFPLIVKSRQSSGSKTFHVTHHTIELQDFLSETPLPIVQEYLDNTGGEFSGCVFVSNQFQAIINFKRELGPVGCTWYAETSTDPKVIKYIRQIAEITKLQGSANIQCRKTSNGVRLLEINARFSSLVAARALCGFPDVEWSIQQALGLPLTPIEPYKQMRFHRFFGEMIDLGNGYFPIHDWNPREH